MTTSFEELLSLLPPEFVPRDEHVARQIEALLSNQTHSLTEGWWWLLCEYQKTWIPLMYLPALISFQNHFRPRDSDVFIATYPKCGTTWIKALAFAILNRDRFPVLINQEKHTEGYRHPLLLTNPHNLVPGLETSLYANQESLPVFDSSSSSSPGIFSTHVPYSLLPESIRSSDAKIVYLWRDPKDAFVSLFHYTEAFKIDVIAPGSFEEAFDLFCDGISPCGSIWDHVLGYCDAANRILFVRYEDLKKNPVNEIKALGEFLGRPFSPEEEESGVVEKIVELCSFGNLSSLQKSRSEEVSVGIRVDGNVFFRNGEVGDGVKHLSRNMVEKVDSITKNKFRGLRFSSSKF